MSEARNAWHLRLAAIRAEQGWGAVDIANHIRVAESDVDAIEQGNLEGVTIAVLRRYVETLGGRLRVAVTLAGREYEIS